MNSKIYIVIILVLVISFLLYIIATNNTQSKKTNITIKKTNISSKPILMLYYTNWCGWSKKFLPVWDQLSNSRKLNIAMQKIDCEKNKNQCSGIPGFPYVVLEKGDKRIEYKGNRTSADIINFVKKNLN